MPFPSMALKTRAALLPTGLTKSWIMSNDMLVGKFSTTNPLKISQIFARLTTTPLASSSAVIAQDTRNVAPGEGRARTPALKCCNCLGETTTANLSTGAVPWTVKVPPSGSVQGTTLASNVAWINSPLSTVSPLPQLLPAKWISPVGNPTAVGVYRYETQFNAQKCIIPSEISISGNFLADNTGVLKIDGKTVASSLGTPNYGFLPGSLTPFSYTIPANSSVGIHTVTMEANNIGGPTGIIVQLSVTRKCAPKDKTNESSPQEPIQ